MTSAPYFTAKLASKAAFGSSEASINDFDFIDLTLDIDFLVAKAVGFSFPLSFSTDVFDDLGGIDLMFATVSATDI